MTLTVTPSVVFADQPCVQLDVTSSPAVDDTLRIYRQHDDGSLHRVLTVERQAKLIGGAWTGLDYHAPFNQEFQYKAETDTDASTILSMILSATWLPSDSTWLIHPSDPTLSVLVNMVTEVAPYSYEDTSQVFQVLGKRLPVVRTDYPRGGEQGSITVLCESPDDRAALKALLASSGPVLLNTPFTDDDLGWKWIQPGTLTIENPGVRAGFGPRTAKIPYREVEQPDADQAAVWTFDDISDLELTFDQIAARYTDFRAMQLDLHS